MNKKVDFITCSWSREIFIHPTFQTFQIQFIVANSVETSASSYKDANEAMELCKVPRIWQAYATFSYDRKHKKKIAEQRTSVCIKANKFEIITKTTLEWNESHSIEVVSTAEIPSVEEQNKAILAVIENPERLLQEGLAQIELKRRKP